MNADRWPRPVTIADARQQIERTYRDNRWNGRDRAVFATMCGLEPRPLDEYDGDAIRTIHERMVLSRMILIKA